MVERSDLSCAECTARYVYVNFVSSIFATTEERKEREISVIKHVKSIITDHYVYKPLLQGEPQGRESGSVPQVAVSRWSVWKVN